MGNVGERLQQARVRAGLSLRDVSVRTKIRAALLDAIEREDFGQLPHGLIARGFLRAYAREVGLDPESVVRQFQDEFEPETVRPDASQAPTTTAVDSDQKHRNDRQRAWLQFLAAAVVAALAGAVFLFLHRHSEIDDRVPSDPIATVGSETETADIDQEAEHAEDEVSGDVAVAAVSTSEADSLTVTISPAGLVWVEATADSTRVLYQLVHPGEQQVIDVRDELLLRVGDAGAFQYSINGVRGRQLGAPGAVRSFRITRENYTTFQDR